MRLQARYAGAYSIAGVHDFDYVLVDPCLDSALVVSTATAVDTVQYVYTASTPAATYSPPAFTITPAFCVPVHSCNILTGPLSTLCSVANGASTSVFDTSNAAYTFSSIDKVAYPPGSYEFEVTATVGSVSSSLTWLLVLVEPCNIATLTLSPSPFSSESKVLGADETTQAWSISTMVSSSTFADCGPYELELFLDDGARTPLDPALFEDRRSPVQFVSLFTTDYSHMGSYAISYRIFYANFATNEVLQTTPFTVTIT